MLSIKKGMPEENEIVLCKVTKILPNSVFAVLEEYNKSGMLHISEISPGRIRNIRDYVKEGKIIICKILNIDMEKGHIDLSLRRVSESQRRKKVDDLKKEQIIEKLITFIAEKHKIDPTKIYNDLAEKSNEEYDTIYDLFGDYVENNVDLSKYGVDKRILLDLQELINQRIKLAEYTIEGTLSLSSREPNGVEIVKEAIKKAMKTNKELDIQYMGAGKFKLKIISGDPKEAEKVIKEGSQIAIDHMKSNKSFGEFLKIS